MGKQKKRNPFFYYMQERKPEIEKRLNRQVTMIEMPQHVTADWQALPDSEKNKYRIMCGQNREKLDCRGVPLRQLQQEAQKQRRQAEEMKRDITEMVDIYHQGNALHQATFYIVSTNYYVSTTLDQHVPAELSILQFSFKRGIMREFHEIVKPLIPLSYAASSRKHSQDTHNLLQDPDNTPGTNLDDVAQSLKQFLSKDWEENVPLYTLHSEMDQTRQILDTITGNELKIYSLDMLYQLMYSVTVQSIPASIANDLITECGLDYYPNLSCPWHIAYQQDSARFCTLSIVRRWLYYMCQHIDLKNKFGVMPVEGKHYPFDEREAGMERSLSTLTLEDTDSAEGAASCDPWTVVGKNSARSTNGNFPESAWPSRKGNKREGARGDRGEVWPWPTVELE